MLGNTTGCFFLVFFYIDSLKGITLQMLQVKCHAILVFLLVFVRVVLALISLALGVLGVLNTKVDHGKKKSASGFFLNLFYPNSIPYYGSTLLKGK